MLKHWNGDYHGTKIFLFDQKIVQEKSEIFLMFADSRKCTASTGNVCTVCNAIGGLDLPADNITIIIIITHIFL